MTLHESTESPNLEKAIEDLFKLYNDNAIGELNSRVFEDGDRFVAVERSNYDYRFFSKDGNILPHLAFAFMEFEKYIIGSTEEYERGGVFLEFEDYKKHRKVTELENYPKISGYLRGSSVEEQESILYSELGDGGFTEFKFGDSYKLATIFEGEISTAEAEEYVRRKNFSLWFVQMLLEYNQNKDKITSGYSDYLANKETQLAQQQLQKRLQNLQILLLSGCLASITIATIKLHTTKLTTENMPFVDGIAHLMVGDQDHEGIAKYLIPLIPLSVTLEVTKQISKNM
jgi:hypothetical protein